MAASASAVVAAAADDELKGIGPAHSSRCDRYLSRVIRNLIEQDVLPKLRHHYRHDHAHDHNDHDHDHDDGGGAGWNLLTRAIDEHAVGAERRNCLLDPRRDVFRHHERRSSEDTLGQHRCDICGKKFRTRFYLDQHMDLRHSHDTGDSSSSEVVGDGDGGAVENHVVGAVADADWICLASELCDGLAGGVRHCEDAAATSEGPYGRGNGDNAAVGARGGGGSRSSCDETAMRVHRDQCRDVVRDCFVGETSTSTSLANDVEHHLCDRLTCVQKIHVKAGHDPGALDRSKAEWEKHFEFRIGVGGVLLLSCVSAFFVVTVYDCFGWYGTPRRVVTSRRNPSSSSRRRWFGRPRKNWEKTL